MCLLTQFDVSANPSKTVSGVAGPRTIVVFVGRLFANGRTLDSEMLQQKVTDWRLHRHGPVTRRAPSATSWRACLIPLFAPCAAIGSYEIAVSPRAITTLPVYDAAVEVGQPARALQAEVDGLERPGEAA